jgi:TonB family protein
MGMNKTLIAMFAALLAVGAAQAKKSEKPIRLNAEWAISLDAQGHVLALKQTTKLKPVLSEPLERAVQAWVFEPGKINGQPAPTETLLRLSVVLKPANSDGYAVSIESAATGGGIARMKPPTYPDQAFRYRQQGVVMVVVNYDESGKVVSASMHAGAQAVPRSLSDAALSAVRQWTFRPETVGQHALAGSVYFPVCFFITDYRQSPSEDACKWTPPGGQHTVSEHDVVALNPAAKLLTDVVGHAL